MKKTTIAVIAFIVACIGWFFVESAAGQVDTVTVQVIDRADVRLIVSPDSLVRRFRGDTVHFSAIAIDTISGDTLDVEFLWTSSNPNVVDINPATGVATFLSRGNTTIIVDVVRLVSLAFASTDANGDWHYITDLSLRVGEEVPLCVYEVNNLGEVALAVPLEGLSSSDPSIVLVNFDPMQTGCPAVGG